MSLRDILNGTEAVVAPCVLNPMMAKLAEAAGFRALYLSGGSLGWLKCVTEATLSLNEMCDAGVEIRAATPLPLILDAAGGWGDPMHIHRTIAMAEAAGFAAIEIEDVVLPKRAHHHVGVDHLISQELMEAKIREAAAARRNPDFVIIARTDSSKTNDLDYAIARAEALRRAGADVVFVWTRNGEQMREVGRRLGPGGPLMVFADREGTGALKVPLGELGSLGYRLIGVPLYPLAAMHKALRENYAALAEGRIDPALAAGAETELKAVFETVGLEALLDVERRTVEPG